MSLFRGMSDLLVAARAVHRQGCLKAASEARQGSSALSVKQTISGSWRRVVSS